MKVRIASVVGILSLFLAVSFLASRVAADEFDQAIRLTFSQPVSIPDHVLPAGSYWFVLAGHGDTNFDEVMQVQDVDKKHTIASIKVSAVETVKSYSKISGHVLLTMADRSPKPQAIVDLTYPGRAEGHTFAFQYSKQEREAFNELPKVTMKVGTNGVLESYTDEKH